MSTKVIALDSGHGLKTSGKQTPNGIKEWTINDKVRDEIAAILFEYNCVIIHTDNNEGNIDESLATRLNKYVSAKVDAFVSIHHNAYKGVWGNATGVEVYTDNNPTDKDNQLALYIYSRLVKNTGLKGRGIKKANFYVINQNRIPAVLVEGGFMDSTNDYKVITSAKGQSAYARAVAEGLIDFLKLEKKNTRYYPRYFGTTVSIVTALNSLKITSSYSYRTKIANANGITSYTGTAAQNTRLLNLLKSGKLIKP